MSESPRVFLSQTSLVCAILSELDRQNPGVLINQAGANAIIQAADDIVTAARQGMSLPIVRCHPASDGAA